MAPPPEPDQRFRHLASLIGAGEIDAFLTDHFGRSPYRSHLAPESARDLFSWPDLNATLAAHRLAPPRLRLERGGDLSDGLFRSRRTRRGATLLDLDPQVLNTRLRDGATLIIDAVNEFRPALRDLCAGLGAEFSAACQANLYACWGDRQGFDVHWDDHDVLVLQVEGSKAWRLYGVTETAPTRRGRAAAPPRPDAVSEEFVLTAGDLLYLPRGHWHAATGRGEPTLHLTIGLTRKSGGDFLHWLADHALAHDLVRQDLPLECGDDVLAAHLAKVVARLSESALADLARDYRRSVEAGQTYRPQLAFPLIGRPDDLDADAEISLAPGPARLDQPDQACAVVLHWRGVAFTLDGRLAPALRRLVTGEPLSRAAFDALCPDIPAPALDAFLADMSARGALLVSGDASS